MPTKRRAGHRRIPKARVLRRSALRRKGVTRAEYNYIIAVLNERKGILDALRDAVTGLEHVTEIQFKRIAQLQADIDALKRDR